jgi:3-deoxy-D-manno-octulosonic-acid transferase
MYFVYNILSLVALLFYLPVLFRKKIPLNRKTFIKECLGRSDYQRADIWVHAVSVGEVIAALPYLKQLKKEFPEIKVVLSTITYTGQRMANEKFPEADRIMYMPWDAGFILHNVVRRIKPRLFITIETELWPNLIRILKINGARVLLMNGRISASSFKGYSRIKPFIAKVLSLIDVLGMQDETGAERIRALGATPDKIKILGSFKFDIQIPDIFLAWTKMLQGPVLSAGSTHRGEDIIILQAYKHLKKQIKELNLILAPRHPERFGEVEALLKQEGIHYLRRSSLDAENSAVIPHATEAILLDTIGELSGVYACSSVAFVGGSLVPVGGHNILEPAYWSKPILFGPYMGNFPIASEFLTGGAAVKVKDAKDIVEAVTKLLTDRQAAEMMGRRARAIIDCNLGAVDRAMEITRPYVSAGRMGS